MPRGDIYIEYLEGKHRVSDDEVDRSRHPPSLVPYQFLLPGGVEDDIIRKEGYPNGRQSGWDGPGNDHSVLSRENAADWETRRSSKSI